MQSLGEELKRYNGLGPGFDFLRIGLATLIVITHCFLLTGNTWFETGPFWFVQYSLVPMFFALSGFLVAGSAMRLSLRNFLINRGLRILPALAVDVTVCALIIGPLVTVYPLHSYFTDTRFFRYFLNVTGYIHYSLPGVFEQQLSTRVNGALWTVPYEMFCYLIMSVLIITQWVKKSSMVASLAIAMLVVGLAVEHFGRFLPQEFQSLATIIFVNKGAQIVLAFVMGILAYQLRDMIPYSGWLLLTCVLICAWAVVLLRSPSIGYVENRFIVLPAVVYITVFLGLTPIPIPKFFHSGDYSYGVYLYHDPLLQVIIGLVPSLVLIPGWGAIALAGIGLPAVVLLATFSWHVVEKPILGLRKRFSFVARVRGVTDKDDVSVAVAPTSVATSQTRV